MHAASRLDAECVFAVPLFREMYTCSCPAAGAVADYSLHWQLRVKACHCSSLCSPGARPDSDCATTSVGKAASLMPFVALLVCGCMATVLDMASSDGHQCGRYDESNDFGWRPPSGVLHIS